MSVTRLFPTHESKSPAIEPPAGDIETAGVHRLPVDDAVHVAAPADTAQLRRTLAATQLRFAAALRQLDRMRCRETLREREVTSLTEAVANARRFAYHDELTGLPNRYALLDHFDLAVALAARHDQHVALLFLDLDRFKHVNDTFGHSVGDKLLQQVAARLLACLRASDTACRYGGDEFIVLLPELDGTDGAVVVADNIRGSLAAPYCIDGAEITVTVSLGIAVHPVDAHSFADLVRVSDRAMYRDKVRRVTPRSLSGATPGSLLGSDHGSNR
jgi:diguanylate cyclase (GGDEF)-like protein